MVNGDDQLRQEFTDWTLDDLIALDDYNNGGSQAVDIYRRWDGFDTSRDLVAFYMRDGGAADGKIYFRVDFQDLQAHAEEGALDLYVVIDFNSPGIGEAALPDEVDARTDMKWEAVVAVYDSQNGRLYVDTNPGNNTLTEWDNLDPRPGCRRCRAASTAPTSTPSWTRWSSPSTAARWWTPAGTASPAT